MRRTNSAVMQRLLPVGLLVLFLTWVAWSGFPSREGNEPQGVANVPQHVSQQGQNMPAAVGTQEPPLPGITPTQEVIPTPTPRIWGAPVPITGVTISWMEEASQVTLVRKEAVDRTERISQIIWAPTGDKLLYVTTSGNLYWCNPDGSNATLLHQYGAAYDQLEAQRPMTNTLLIRHEGILQPNGERPAHMDVVRFTLGQPPILEEGPSLAHPPHHLHWWSSDRASGIAHRDYTGGTQLVTVDANGNLVTEVNVPHMASGFVRPGGQWLAYATNNQMTTNVDGSTPATTYLLNLNTGERRQLTQPGQGYAVGDWSPDGNWFLMLSNVGVAVVSANGQEWITIPDGTVDAVWSPDSRYLAFSRIEGQGGDGHYGPRSWTGATYVVDVLERRVTRDQISLFPGGSIPSLIAQPKWSPDSSLIAFLSRGHGASDFSLLTPAYYLMSIK